MHPARREANGVKIGAQKRAAVIERDDSTCYLCHRKLEYDEITIDHVTPPGRGGTKELDNLKVACYRCNNIKGGRLVEECSPDEFITNESPIKVSGPGVHKREKLAKAHQRIYLVQVAVNVNTPQAVIERMIEAARQK